MVTRHVRATNLERLSGLGFVVADGLPLLREGRGVRTPREIATRLCAIDAVFTWVTDPRVAEARIRGYAERSGLFFAMTDREREIWKRDREQARAAQDTIGWKLENAWALAWALGFDPAPAIDGDMIDESTIQAIGEFLPSFDDGVDGLMARATPRSEADLDAMEDLFYCAHNAARSAQLGHATVPRGFHPVVNGGVIHERRHALSWIVSPGTAWDDVDLST